MIDGYNVNNVDDVVENDMKMQLMMMILKDRDEMKQLQSMKIVAKYFQNLGDSLLLPNELIKVQAVLAEEFYYKETYLMHILCTFMPQLRAGSRPVCLGGGGGARGPLRSTCGSRAQPWWGFWGAKAPDGKRFSVFEMPLEGST